MIESTRSNPSRPITAPEVAWFAALCDDDYRWLGVADPALRSSWEHCRDITVAADAAGYDNILLPSGYQLGIDGTAFAAGASVVTDNIKMLLAVRCGELWPPQLARQLATLDQMLGGRLTINIISSDLPGAPLESEPRYRRTAEVMTILRTLLNGETLSHHGEFYDLELGVPNVSTTSGQCPPFYFGGLSEPAREVAAQHSDVYLMWPDVMSEVTALIDDLSQRAARYDRTLRFGYRCHVIVRETEALARDAARELVSRLDDDTGQAIKGRSLDTTSRGVTRQADLAAGATDEGFVEPHLWTGISRGRSGCGAAIVGDPDQVLSTIRSYQDVGIDTFIFSGYPHIEACDLFARYVLPELRQK